VSISVNGAGETCVAYLNRPPNFPFVSGDKLRSDGSLAYSIVNLPGNFILGAIDSGGNCYFVGKGKITPTPGAFQSTPPFSDGGTFIVKLDGSGNTSYATYLSGADNPTGMAVDNAGNLYLTGDCLSAALPTVHAYQPLHSGGSDLFIAALNSTGTGLIYATFWGGSSDESKPAIAVDATHNLYITGATTSSDFPTVLPLEGTFGGFHTAFVIKLSSNGTPVYATYLGDHSGATGTGVAADSSGSAYVVGFAGPGFPLVNPIVSTTVSTTSFVAKFSPDGSALAYSTYLEPGFSGSGIVVDSAGQAYVAVGGPSSVSPILSGDSLSVLNSSGTGFIFSTGIGGSPTSIGIDSVPNIYVAGTVSFDEPFPILNASNGTVVRSKFLEGLSQGYRMKISLSPGISLSHPDSLDFQRALRVGEEDDFADLLVANTSASGNVAISSIAISPGDFTETDGMSGDVGGKRFLRAACHLCADRKGQPNWNYYHHGHGARQPPFDQPHGNGLGTCGEPKQYIADVCTSSPHYL
jgi:hypothetical protein